MHQVIESPVEDKKKEEKLVHIARKSTGYRLCGQPANYNIVPEPFSKLREAVTCPDCKFKLESFYRLGVIK